MTLTLELTDEQERGLQQEAARRGVNENELIRRLVEQLLQTGGDERAALIDNLAAQSIAEHRTTLEGLAR